MAYRLYSFALLQTENNQKNLMPIPFATWTGI